MMFEEEEQNQEVEEESNHLLWLTAAAALFGLYMGDIIVAGVMWGLGYMILREENVI